VSESALLGLLGAIRHRPGMFVGDEVRDLANFFAGFFCGLRYLDHDDTGDCRVLHDFEVWLKAKYGVTHDATWSSLIETQFRERPDLRYAHVEGRSARAGSTKLFFIELETFLATRGIELRDNELAVRLFGGRFFDP
jgi:hypothetical protein